MRAPRKLLAFNVYYFDTQVPQDQSFNKSRKDFESNLFSGNCSAKKNPQDFAGVESSIVAGIEKKA